MNSRLEYRFKRLRINSVKLLCEMMIAAEKMLHLVIDSMHTSKTALFFYCMNHGQSLDARNAFSKPPQRCDPINYREIERERKKRKRKGERQRKRERKRAREREPYDAKW